ncbi:MAG: DNA recombination protein RmuC, partial [Clostridiales bacterium]|nr:DNA recombination protein RmuC [Clostridiales bacterium]
MPLEYLLIGIIAALVLVVIVLALSFASTKREVSSSRKETEAAIRDGLMQMGRVIADTTMQQDQRMEYLRSGMEERLNSMQQSNERNMEKIRETVDEKLSTTLDERLTNSFSHVRTSLDEVYKGLGEMQTLARSVGDLKKLLSNVKTRGV